MVAGPLPTLDGITNVQYKSQRKTHVPQITLSPAVNEHVQEFKTIFLNAGPENGFLTGEWFNTGPHFLRISWRPYSEEKVLNVYMAAADLSYEDIRSIMSVFLLSVDKH